MKPEVEEIISLVENLKQEDIDIINRAYDFAKRRMRVNFAKAANLTSTMFLLQLKI